MHIVVCVKSVPDTARLKFDTQGALLLNQIEHGMNPFCEYAVEAALRFKESGFEETTITAVSYGPESCKETLKRAVGMGADTAIWIQQTSQGLDSLAIATILAQALIPLAPDWVFMGQQSTDAMTASTGSATAALLGFSSLSQVKQVLRAEGLTEVKRQTTEAIETYTASANTVFNVMKCDFEPRIPSIKGVMKANRTELIVMEEPPGVQAKTRIVELKQKAKKQAGQKISGVNASEAVDQLMAYLKQQQVV
jgi:electron transfer flavoprotein beta subunit